MRRVVALFSFSLIALTTSCEKKSPETASTPPPARAVNTSTQIFQVKGVVVELIPAEKTIRIKHEEIPGYMDAMTMPFDVRDTNEFAGLEAGDTVAFRMLVTEKDGWIDQIKKLSVPKVNVSSNAPVRIARDVEPLDVGDALPEYQLTNQLGEPFSTARFKGQALAITFIFTRCPFPTFCPRMTGGFVDAQKKLLTNTGGPTNWHLLTISFDPEFDSPTVLKNYAASNGADPRHWTFATGALVDITAITEQLGLQFWREPGGNISHNLRTVVVNAAGKVQTNLVGNAWTGDELAAEIVKAAGTMP